MVAKNKMEIRKIAYIGELERTPDSPDHRGIRQGLENYESLIVDPVLYSPEENRKKIEDFKPDLIIHQNTDSLGQELGKIFRPYTKYQVFWQLDFQPTMEGYCWDRWNTEGYDAVFLSNRDQIQGWGEKFNAPCHYLPHGCVVQTPIYDEKFRHKVLFIGGMIDGDWYSDRFKLLQELQPFDHITGEGVEGRNEVWRNMPALYHSSDCVIDVSHSWTADGYASGRFFYTGGLGACSITRRFPGCEDLYPKGTKAYFETPEEAKELIEFYTTHKAEREMMKYKAWKHNQKFHTYKQRFEEICSKLT